MRTFVILVFLLVVFGCSSDTFDCQEIPNQIMVIPDESAALISFTSGNDFLRMSIEYGPKGFQQGQGTILSNFGIVSPSATDPNVFNGLITGLRPNTEYDVYVTASCLDGSGETVLGPQTFTTITFGQGCTRPTQFALGLVSSSGANLSWNGNDEMQWEVSWYEVLTDSTDVLVDIELSDEENFEITSLQSGTSYRTTVRARCSEGEFEFSDYSIPRFIEFTTLR